MPQVGFLMQPAMSGLLTQHPQSPAVPPLINSVNWQFNLPLHTDLLPVLGSTAAPTITRDCDKYLQTSLNGGIILPPNTTAFSNIIMNQAQMPGVAIERQAINEVQNPTDLADPAWINWGVNVSAKNVTDPYDQINSAQRIDPLTSDPAHPGQHVLSQLAGGLVGQPLGTSTLSFQMWAKLPPDTAPGTFSLNIIRLDSSYQEIGGGSVAPFSIVDHLWRLLTYEVTFTAIAGEAHWAFQLDASSLSAMDIFLPSIVLTKDVLSPPLDTRLDESISWDLQRCLRGDQGSILFNLYPLHPSADGADHHCLTIAPVTADPTSYLRLKYQETGTRMVLESGSNQGTISSLVTGPVSWDRMSSQRVAFSWGGGTAQIFLNGVQIANDVFGVGTGLNPLPTGATLGLGVGPHCASAIFYDIRASQSIVPASTLCQLTS